MAIPITFAVIMTVVLLLFLWGVFTSETSIERWSLLFQLDTVEYEDFELMFGDCGHIYFYIKKDDLSKRNFDQIWLTSTLLKPYHYAIKLDRRTDIAARA